MFCLNTVCSWDSPWHGSGLCWRAALPLARSVTLNLLCAPTWMLSPWGLMARGLGGWSPGKLGKGSSLPPSPDSSSSLSCQVSRPSAQPLLSGTWQRGRAAGVAWATLGCPATSPLCASRAQSGPIRGPAWKQVSLGQSPPPYLLPPGLEARS